MAKLLILQQRCGNSNIDSGHSRVETGPHSWSIQLDQDLLDTIIAIYPEWFKEYNYKLSTMSEGSGGVSGTSENISSSNSSCFLAPEVDESPLRNTMFKNKESLKVKLMMRRPINQLVAQGIMPSLKTPPAFHEQRQKLERAKMVDLLKAKIQQRPDREELVRQHILEADVGHVDPSLAERQRMLKKARLADSLNDQLSHRPGPLELIKKNILHTEEPIERAVKEGVIPFKATSEGQLRKPQHPDHYITFEEDSQSSEGAGSPSNSTNSLPTIDNNIANNKAKERQRDVLETAAASAGIVNVAVTIPAKTVVVTSPILQQIPNDKNQSLQTFAELCSSVVSPVSLGSSTSSLSPLSSIASPPTPLTPKPVSLSSPAPGKADKNRKKPKTKTQPKTRTIKFHEYKGPPNAQKNSTVNNSSTETSYELLLQQQQLFLQWQLEWQHKYPQIILPAAQKPSSEGVTNIQTSLSGLTNASNGGTTFLVTPFPRAGTPLLPTQTPQSAPPSSPLQSDSQSLNQTSQIVVNSALKVLTKLEEMKVSDLKIELKKRNLPVSGPKPQLIERLKPFAQTDQVPDKVTLGTRAKSSSNGENQESVVSEMDVAVSPPPQEEDESHFSPLTQDHSPPVSPAPMDDNELSPPTSSNNDDMIIQQQQRKIEELQRELQKSQQQLQQIRQNKEATVSTSLPDTATSTTFVITAKPPPPQYEEATKALKGKGTLEDSKRSKTIKSQIVDDVLEILIKNGELPPSAANDPSTPNTPGGHPEKELIYPPAPPPPPPPPPLPQPGFSVTLPTTINLSSQSHPPPQFNLPNTTFSTSTPFTITTQNVSPTRFTLTETFIPTSTNRDSEGGNEVVSNNVIFSVSNRNFLNTENTNTNSKKNTYSSDINFVDNAKFISADTSDFDMNSNDQNFHSNSLDYILSNDNLIPSELSSSDNILPSEYANGDINLKELGLDLETLDSMDFSQLDCKMESNEADMDSSTATEENTISTSSMSNTASRINKTDQLINNNPDLVKPELVEPMEMDDNWLDSLMPLSENQPNSQFGSSLSSSSNGFEFLHCSENAYDSLLGNAQDPFELFDIYDFKLPSSSLSWDKVDFAT